MFSEMKSTKIEKTHYCQQCKTGSQEKQTLLFACVCVCVCCASVSSIRFESFPKPLLSTPDLWISVCLPVSEHISVKKKCSSLYENGSLMLRIDLVKWEKKKYAELCIFRKEQEWENLPKKKCGDILQSYCLASVLNFIQISLKKFNLNSPI